MIPTPLTDAQHATTIYGAPKSQAFVKYERDSYEAMLVLARELERKLTEKDAKIAQIEKEWNPPSNAVENHEIDGLRSRIAELERKLSEAEAFENKILAISADKSARIAELEKIVVIQ